MRRAHFPKAPGRLAKLLPKELLEPVAVPAPGQPTVIEGPLAAAWLETGKSHKWLHYFPVYERAFSGFVGRPLRFLEIGVQNGGSLSMWKGYFGPQATIVGIDIDPACAAHDDPANDVHVRIGSQADAEFLASLIEEFGPFDAILDDGSHQTAHIVTTFGRLFDEGLREGGLYAVEDTHATYWPKFRDVPHSFSEFCLYLSDLMHAHYFGAPGARHFLEGHRERLREATVPRLATLLDSVEISDSVVLIRKSAGERRLPVNIDLPNARQKPQLKP